jgi:hypothetical protein
MYVKKQTVGSRIISCVVMCAMVFTSVMALGAVKTESSYATGTRAKYETVQGKFTDMVDGTGANPTKGSITNTSKTALPASHYFGGFGNPCGDYPCLDTDYPTDWFPPCRRRLLTQYIMSYSDLLRVSV